MVLCLPRLGAFGLWEPWELNIADHARQVADDGVGVGAFFKALVHADLTSYLQALGIGIFGPSEFGARIFGALTGVGGLMAIFWAGTGLFRARAALLSVLTLGTTPLFILSARQVTSNTPLVAALALALGAFGRWIWPSTGKRNPRDLGLGVLALALAFGAGGALLGVAVPCLALVSATLIGAGLRVQSDTSEAAADTSAVDDLPSDGTQALASFGAGVDVLPGVSFGASLRKQPTVIAALAALGLLGVVFLVIALSSSIAGRPSIWMGGTPRAGVPSITFEYLVRQLGFGLFPWSAVAFFALGRPLIRLDEDEDGPRTNRRLAFGQTYLLLFAGLAFVLGSVQALVLGEARYAGLAAIALALGTFLDEALEGNRPEPVAGLLMATGTMIVARDFFLAPEDLVSLHLLGEKVKWPATVVIGHWMLVFGLLVAAGVYVGLATRGRALGKVPAPDLSQARAWRRKLDARFVQLGKSGLQMGVVTSVVFALWLTQFVLPTLSNHFSFKPVMESYSKYARSGEKFGRFRVEGKGTSFYTRTTMVDLPTHDGVVNFLRSSERVFALVSADELATLDAAFKTGQVPYFAVDASSSRFLLLSNRLAAGEQDDNPLKKNVWMAATNPVNNNGQWNPSEHPPWTWRVPAAATFGDVIEVVGANFQETLRRPGSVKLELFFRVKGKVPGSYKIFVHLDGPAAPRAIGDHDPVGKAFPTNNWLPGEYVRDIFDIEMPLMTTPAGTYQVFFGFWPGGEGKRLKITAGPNDGSDRVHLGNIEVK